MYFYFQVLNEIDEKLDSDEISDINDALVKLSDLCIEHPQNVELLWRIGKGHKELYDKNDDLAAKQDNLTKGICIKLLNYLLFSLPIIYVVSPEVVVWIHGLFCKLK